MEQVMKRAFLFSVLAGGALFLFSNCFSPSKPGSDYPAAAVPFTDVKISDRFWQPHIERNRSISIPRMFEEYKRTGHTPDLKLVEAAAYELAKNPDPVLKQYVDEVTDREIEGFRSRAPGKRWIDLKDGELYSAGHLFEAAVACFEATGDRKLLNAAIEIADNIDSVFGPRKRRDVSGHEEVKIGLIKLYRCTGNERYLKLARFFLDERGYARGGRALYGEYAQDHEPVKLQSKALGHCVRATYLYMPLTDLAALTGDPEYGLASERLWEDVTTRRTYLTGGIGSHRDLEDFGDDYELPNLSCWNEICAAIGNALWNQRLFLLKLDAKYIDVLERVLYNGLLVGVSLSGDTYLYQAPLKACGSFARHPWFGPNCCPPNIARFLARMGDLIYAHDDNSLYVNLFVGSRAKASLKETGVSITQETVYPWEGAIRITIDPDLTRKFFVFVRIPGWAQNRPMPGDLYRYLAPSKEPFALTVNKKPAAYVLERGYARIEREWAKGDVIELNLPMPVQRVLARDHVADDRGMVALEHGPLVYCAEGIDNGGRVFNLLIPDTAQLQFSYRADLLDGIGTIIGDVAGMSRSPDGTTIKKQRQGFTAIPYYAFASRGLGEMSVWLARDESRVVLPPAPTIASTSRAGSSSGNGTVAENYPGGRVPSVASRFYPSSQDGSGEIGAIYDQVTPVNSADGSWKFLRLRPPSGDQAWIQYDFAKPTRVSSVDVYWKDDREYCVLPKAWRLLYRDGSAWKPVRASGTYGVERDKFNTVAFEPVTTSGVRIEVQLQGKLYKKGDLGPPDANYMQDDLIWYEGGIIEWRVNR
jgi:DUF1680 family protein